jgi:hypothetical protein
MRRTTVIWNISNRKKERDSIRSTVDTRKGQNKLFLCLKFLQYY